MTDIKPLGDSALIVQFDNRIDPSLNAKVIALCDQLLDAQVSGVLSASPAYSSVLVQYDPVIQSFDEVKEIVESSLKHAGQQQQPESHQWRIPVCYDSQFALDRDNICAHTGLTWDEIINAHSSIAYRVYMLGFLPGFSYMGKVPEALDLPRKATPRQDVPERSVGIAGIQTAIYPIASPGGWQILGRTPLPMLMKDVDNPFALHPGDEVTFYPVEENTYLQLRKGLERNDITIAEFHVR